MERSRVPHSQAPTATNTHVGDTSTASTLSKDDYEALANLRYAVRRFSRQTEIMSRRFGSTPQQYLLLLAIKGFPGRDWASITELAERLQIRHNAVIGLVNRAEERGLVSRRQDPNSTDRRVVEIHLTSAAERLLEHMASALDEERQQVRIALNELDPQMR